MLLPDPPAALRHVRTLLGPTGASTSPRPSSTALARRETLKPLLRPHDDRFGRVTYEPDFRRALAAGGKTIEALEVLNEGPRRSGVLAVSRPT